MNRCNGICSCAGERGVAAMMHFDGEDDSLGEEEYKHYERSACFLINHAGRIKLLSSVSQEMFFILEQTASVRSKHTHCHRVCIFVPLVSERLD